MLVYSKSKRREKGEGEGRRRREKDTEEHTFRLYIVDYLLIIKSLC